ncbi:MAG: DUF481 domain-containing protein [Opitutales bacterium]|nr:DUF481 domain-containing protein [Opitutales bacterium]
MDGIAGIGYYFLRTPKYQWQFSLGLNYEEREYLDLSGISIPSEDSTKIGFFEQFTAQPLPFINITHTFYYAVDVDDQDIYDYILSFGISTPITQNTSIGLKYDRQYNSSVPDIFQAFGIEEETTTIAVQLGYTF